MSDGPAPGLVADWLTPGAFLGVFWLLCLLALTFYILDFQECDRCADEPAPIPVSPCVNSGHAYRAQPKVYRCVNCGDERVTEDVYDQEHVA
jgi:hypothetical protein